jgi:hypothetical protein
MEARRSLIAWLCRSMRWAALMVAVWVAASSLALQPTGSTFAAGTLDQEQATGGYPSGFGDRKRIAQTFTAGRTGHLDHVEVSLQGLGFSGPVTVEIRNTVSHLPGSTVLATTTVPEASLPTGRLRFMSFYFAPAAPVIAGTEYAFVIQAPGGNSMGVDGSQAEAYASGAALVSTNSGTSFSAAPVADYKFQTFVETATFTPTPTPGPCAASIRISVSQVRTAANLFTTTVRTNHAGNVVRELRFGAATNASITAGTSTGAGPFTVELPENTVMTTFTVSAVAVGQPIHVPLIVLDNCGTWSTFVGAGPSAQ